MKSAFALAALAASVTAYSNSVPIFGTYPGFSEGEDAVGIQVDLFIDLLCGDCARENPVINELMTTEWLGGTVADQIKVSFTPFPLPYHMFSFQVSQIVPYLMDLCVTDASQCDLQFQYKDYCYTQFDTVLSSTNLSVDEFIPLWTAQVADALNLDQATLESLYASDDKYNTSAGVRDF